MAIYNNERDPNEVDLEKTEYTFYIDRKVTLWVREEHCISANSQEEANQKMTEAFKKDWFDDTFVEQEWLDDTFSDLSPEDNGGEPTAELLTEDLDTLATNAEKTNKIL